MEAIREVTDWNVDYRQPNHDYLLKGDKIIAYRKWSSGPVIPCSGKITLNRSRRKFVKIDPSVFGKLFKEDTPEARVIEVSGSKGNIYRVNLDKKTCTCSGFSFRGSCKHLKMAA